MRMIGDQRIVDRVMIGGDENGAVTREHLPVERYRISPRDQRMIATGRKHRNMRIVKIHLGASLLEQLDELECRALSHVGNILLVGNADDENSGAAQGKRPALIESLHQ